MELTIRIPTMVVIISVLATVIASPAAGAALRPEPRASTLIHIGGYHGDPTSDPELKSTSAGTHRLRLVQLTGPVRDDWREQLEAGGLQVLAYVPHNAYLVWAEVPGIDAAAHLDQTPFVRWNGPVPAPAKRSPLSVSNDGVTELMVLHVPQDGEFHALVASLGGRVERSHSAQPDDRLQLSLILLDSDRHPILTAADGIVWIEPAPGRPELGGEMSSLIVSGGFDTASPAPGYRAWLDDLGFDGTGVLWAVVDSGVDPLHPDLAGLQGISYPGCETDLPGDDPGDVGHGTPVASIVLGTAAAGRTDPDGFLWGLGVAPGARPLSQNAICSGDVPWPPDGGWQILSRDGILAGAVGSNNSWNSQEGDAHGYQISERTLDLMVRDGNFETPNAAEPYIMVFNGGNHGPEPSAIPAPMEAKNLITVGAIDNWRVGGDVHTVVDYSSRGPTVDGRMYPTVVAPGRRVGAALHRLKGFYGLIYEVPDTDGLYMSFEGTSAAAPHVAGMLAVATEWWRATRPSNSPSPAAARAMVVNAAVPLDEGPAPPNFDAGWGLANLGRMIAPDDPVWILDQTALLTTAGGAWQQRVMVANPSQPLRVTLAWTDAAAAAGAEPTLVNDLDLTVTSGAATYLGNNLVDGWSIAGGTADRLNNLEDVHIAVPGATAVIAVTAANLPGDGVPYNGDLTDQDFTLICRNCRAPMPAPRSPSGRVAP